MSDVAQEPAEVWTPPGYPVDGGICDDDGIPLTWSRVRTAHRWLVDHATCDAAGEPGGGAAGYDAPGLRLRRRPLALPLHLRPAGDRGARVPYVGLPRLAWARLRLLLGRELRVWLRLRRP